MSCFAATFTLRTLDVSETATAIHSLHAAFGRLCRRLPLRDAAFARASQVNLSADGTVNPHLHALFLLPAASGKPDLSRQAWQTAAKLDYLPVVQANRAYTPPRWMSYLCKPPIKIEGDLSEAAPYLPELARQLADHHLFQTGHKFPKAARDKKRGANDPKILRPTLFWENGGYHCEYEPR
jgi:hypothetical protein